MTTKMKGLLKGLRYISQIFENEEEEEIQIGFPTDVKHVAHIGCDGPAATTPSWMDEFKAPTGISSAPVASGETKDVGPTELTSQDSVRSNSSFVSCPSPGRDKDMPYLPKSSRSRRSVGSESSGTKGKSEKSARHSRRASKGSESGRDLAVDSALGSESPMRYPAPDIPKKSRRKKSKESGTESSRPSRSSKSQPSASTESTLPDQGPGQLGTQGPKMEAFEEMGDKRISITS